MKHPVEPNPKTRYSKLDDKSIDLGSCTVQDLVDLCTKEGIDPNMAEISLEYPNDGITVFEDMSPQEHREAWIKYGREEDAYFRWAEENAEEAEKQAVEEQIEKLQGKLNKLKGEE